MPKVTITAVRHAQGFHNLSTANHTLPDPSLTPIGEQQCSTLNALYPHHSQITHLVASPLRRTLYTTLLSFPSSVARGIKVIALPEIQETSGLPCDTGSDREVLEKEFNKGQVDLSLVKEGWNDKKGKWSPAASQIEARAREARVWLRDLAAEYSASHPEQDVHIAVVTHGGFLHYFTEDWNGHDRFTGTGWANTEYRTYEFVGQDLTASLVELEESRSRRGERPLSEAEQRNLRASAENEWQQSGFQTPKEMEVEQIAVA